MNSLTQTVSFRKNKFLRIGLSILIGIIIPITFALIMNKAVAQVINEKELPEGSFIVAENTATAMQAMNKAVQAKHAPAIYGILVNDTADSDGYVTEKKTNLPATATKIFVTVQITDSTPGIKVSASVNGIDNGMSTDPAVTITSKTGNIMKAFTFTNNDKVWPKGDYKVDVTLSTGEEKNTTFTIG